MNGAVLRVAEYAAACAALAEKLADADDYLHDRAAGLPSLRPFYRLELSDDQPAVLVVTW